MEAQSESPVAQEALEKLCRAYWRPIYGFVQRQGIGPEEAKDITQGFFADLLEHKSLAAVRKEKGRFRSYLLGALKYFLADERRRAMAIKRGKGQLLIPLEELSPDERTEIELTDPLTAEQIYERRWASTVLARVLGLLKNEYVAAGNATLFDCLKATASGRPRLAVASGDRRTTRHDRQCCQAGVSSISSALSIVITRGNCSHRCYARRRRRRVASSDCCRPGVEPDVPPAMATVTRVCRKCGAKIFSDAPEGLCTGCVLETALGIFPDTVAGVDDCGSADKLVRDESKAKPPVRTTANSARCKAAGTS